MCSLYVLQLEKGRWYVGSTIRYPGNRIREHREGCGCKFTKRFPMVRVTHCFPVDMMRASQLENETWMWLARRYGPEMVRGGDVTIDAPIPGFLLPDEFGGERIVAWG